MPTKTFYNLEKNKQERFIKCAINEFSRVPFHEVSLNNIITNADISRGSFYMYFKDKDDLFEYLLFSHKEYIEQSVLECILLNNGDLKESFKDIYDRAIKYKNMSNYKDFLNNVFMYLNSKNKDYILPKNDLIIKAREIININQFKDINNFEVVFEMLMNNVFMALCSKCEVNYNLERINYLKRLDIICDGFYRRKK